MNLTFHHINLVADDVDRLHDFYTRVLGLSDMPVALFPRTQSKGDTGYDGAIRFAEAPGSGSQFHIAQRDLSVAFRHGQSLNPVARGHIAFRTDDLAAVLQRLNAEGVPYADYGTAFSAEWHQVFFQDPEGNVIEIHQAVA